MCYWKLLKNLLVRMWLIYALAEYGSIYWKYITLILVIYQLDYCYLRCVVCIGLNTQSKKISKMWMTKSIPCKLVQWSKSDGWCKSPVQYCHNKANVQCYYLDTTKKIFDQIAVQNNNYIDEYLPKFPSNFIAQLGFFPRRTAQQCIFE